MNYDDVENPYSNQLYTDGVSGPSEFAGSPYDMGDMVGAERPACELDMTCEYCVNTEAGCSSSTVPDDFTTDGTWTPPDGAGDDDGGEEGGTGDLEDGDDEIADGGSGIGSNSLGALYGALGLPVRWKAFTIGTLTPLDRLLEIGGDWVRDNLVLEVKCDDNTNMREFWYNDISYD